MCSGSSRISKRFSIYKQFLPLMYQQSFFPTEILAALIALELSNITVSFHMSCVMRFGIHCEATDVALISLYSEMNNVKMIDDMRFVFEFESTSVTCEGFYVIFRLLSFMSCPFMIRTFRACVELFEAITT